MKTLKDISRKNRLIKRLAKENVEKGLLINLLWDELNDQYDMFKNRIEKLEKDSYKEEYINLLASFKTLEQT